MRWENWSVCYANLRLIEQFLNTSQPWGTVQMCASESLMYNWHYKFWFFNCQGPVYIYPSKYLAICFFSLDANIFYSLKFTIIYIVLNTQLKAIFWNAYDFDKHIFLKWHISHWFKSFLTLSKETILWYKILL